jgi:hypothetical protein
MNLSQTIKQEKEIKRIESKKGKIVKFINKYGWTTSLEYRKCMDDLVIKQFTKDKDKDRFHNCNRYIYLEREHLNEILNILMNKRK